MIIYCGNGVSFSVNNLENEASVFLNLLSVYFVFDIDYPTSYPILPILEHLCFPENSIPGSAPPTKKSKQLKSKSFKTLANPHSKMSVACKQFVKSFESFLHSN